ncbi:MAG: hypothetical protein COB53_08605 [Elusimicrobia bacterium]|nr:MAG: hypothetical protein COB53_08605 [Elusimicrobiota bacterium]
MKGFLSLLLLFLISAPGNASRRAPVPVRGRISTLTSGATPVGVAAPSLSAILTEFGSLSQITPVFHLMPTVSPSLRRAPVNGADVHPDRRRNFSLPVTVGLENGLDELRGVGILAVDLKDSTRLYREEGVQRGYETGQAYLQFAGQTARKHGGRIVRHMGDGYLFLFPDVARAFDAGIEVQSSMQSVRDLVPGRDLAFHVSVHRGRVIVHRRGEGLDAYGQSLEQALSYSDRSDGDDVVLDKNVAKAAGIQRRLKGLPQMKEGGLVRVFPALDPEFRKPIPGLQREMTLDRIVTRATMFAFLKDWASTYDDFGRRNSYASIRAYQDYVRRIVSNNGGLVVKTEGEGVMMSFISPADALRAAAEIQRELEALKRAAPLGDRMEIQIGVSYGRVVREQTLDGIDFFGNTVNAAARLMKRSRGGDIVVSRRLALDAEAARIIQEASGEKALLTLKGFGAPVNSFRIEPESIKTERSYEGLYERLAKSVRDTLKAIARLRERGDYD